MSEETMQYRWERRAAKLESRRKRMKMHSKSLGEIYANSVLKKYKKKPLTGDLPCDIIELLEEDLEEV
jgi:hypothetical protein